MLVVINNKFVRFIFVGLLNTAFGIGLYCFLIYLGFPYYLSLLLSTVLGVLFNFKTIGVIVFNNRNNGLLIKFSLCYAFVYVINVFLVKILVEFTALDNYLAGVIIIPFTAIISFVIQKNFVFHKKEKL